MTTEEALLRDHVARWKRLGPALEQIRLDELRSVDTAQAIRQLAPAFELAVRQPPRGSAGLVEQQAIFKKLHSRK
jgi:hypothetical protein